MVPNLVQAQIMNNKVPFQKLIFSTNNLKKLSDQQTDSIKVIYKIK